MDNKKAVLAQSDFPDTSEPTVREMLYAERLLSKSGVSKEHFECISMIYQNFGNQQTTRFLHGLPDNLAIQVSFSDFFLALDLYIGQAKALEAKGIKP